jgi:hypothetical protein
LQFAGIIESQVLLEEGDEEGEGFAAAGLRFNSKIVVLEEKRNGSLLDWEHCGEVVLQQRCKYLIS